MFYQIIVFVLLTAAGFLICRQLLKIPKLSMKKNIKNLQTEKEKAGEKILNRFVMPLVKPVSRWIRLDPAKEAKMASMIRRGGLDLTPREYQARALICAAFTLLLPNATFTKSQVRPNRCESIRQYVLEGGAFMMIGGYMSFSGIDAKARYGQTALRDILPVKCLEIDDREEHSEGVTPTVIGDHEALTGLPELWPHFLGYNKTLPIEGCEVPVVINGDPLIAFGSFGKGKSAVFTSDCAPHWGTPEFVNWEGYKKLWKGILDYITRK